MSVTGKAITANGNTQVIDHAEKGTAIISVYGTFGGASLTLGRKVADGTVAAYAIDNTAVTAANEWRLECGVGADVYIIAASTTGTTNIKWDVRYL